MSDYTKTTNFTAKDALASGDANKIILGADFDTEFDALATAIATKLDDNTSFTITNSAPSITFDDSDASGTVTLTQATGAFNISVDPTGVDASSIFSVLVDGDNRLNIGTVSAIFNEDGNDFDFRVETPNLTHALFIEGGKDAIGVGTSTINASALFELVSTTKGFRVMNMTEAQRDAISTPAAGLVVYVTDGSNANKLHFYNGSAWGPV